MERKVKRQLITDQCKTPTVPLILTMLIILIIMSVYEMTKQVMFPNLTVWQSHIMTIGFSAIVATIAVYFVWRERRSLLQQLAAETCKHRQTDELLQESEKRFRNVSELISDYVYVLRVEPNGWLVREWVAEAITRITGYTLKELDALEGWINPVHPDDREIVIHHRQMFKSDKENVSEYRIIRKDGEVRWLCDYSCPIWDEAQKRVVYIYGVAQDITERKRVEEELKRYRHHLEEMIEARTMELTKTNKRLQQEITEHKRAEEELRDSEERFRTIVETAPSLLHITDAEGNNVYVSPNCEEITGYTQQELTGKFIWWVHDDDAPRVKKIFEHAFQEKVGSKNFGYKAMKKNGSVWYASTSWDPLRGKEGEFKGFVVQTIDISDRKWVEEELRGHRDHLEKLIKNRTAELIAANEQLQQEITERKRMEEALAKERNLLRTLIDNLPDHIYVKDIESRFLLFNNAVMHTMGVTTPSELMGKTDFDFYPSELAEQYYANERVVIESGQPLPNREEPNIDRETGARIWFLTTTTPFWDSQGNIVGVLGIARDITERKQMEEELRKHRNHLEELVKEHTNELSTANEHLQQEIIERKRVEEELQKAKEAAETANQAKSEFLTNMSHELRTPLNAILGYTQILNREKNLTEQQRRAIDTIQHSGEHLLDMINDVLDLSKIEAQKLEPEPVAFHLHGFLRNIVDIYQMKAEQKGITFSYECAPDVPTFVVGDKRFLRQILLNLLSNAVKFTEEGQVLFKVLKKSSPDETPLLIPPRGENQRGVLRFQIEDTGIGIAPDQLDRIFMPFEQVHDRRFPTEGAGLGLAISQKLARLMNSELYVTSTVGEGSTFWFDLKLPEVADGRVIASMVKPSLTVIGYEGERRTILLVDDDEDNRTVLKDTLLSLGFEVIEAADGRDGLDKASAFQPDLMLVDVYMPVIDGFDVIRQLRQIPALKESIVIAISAWVSEQTQRQCSTAGFDEFIAKPIALKSLLERLQHYLQIEWNYEDTKSPQKTGKDKGIDIIIPPQEDIQALFRLAMRGNLKEINHALDTLDQADSRVLPFTMKIRELSKEFQINQIREFLKRYLEK